MKHRYSQEQIVQILREAESGVQKAELCRKYGIWRQRYSEMQTSQLRRLRQLQAAKEAT